VHAKLLFTAGHMAWLYDLDGAKRYCDQALQISRELGDQINIAWALTFKSYAMMREMETAIAVAEEGLALFRGLGHRPGIAQALNIIGEIARFARDDARAKRPYEECLVVPQEPGETRRTRFMYSNPAFLAPPAPASTPAQTLPAH